MGRWSNSLEAPVFQISAVWLLPRLQLDHSGQDSKRLKCLFTPLVVILCDSDTVSRQPSAVAISPAENPTLVGNYKMKSVGRIRGQFRAITD